MPQRRISVSLLGTVIHRESISPALIQMKMRTSDLKVLRSILQHDTELKLKARVIHDQSCSTCYEPRSQIHRRPETNLPTVPENCSCTKKHAAHSFNSR